MTLLAATTITLVQGSSFLTCDQRGDIAGAPDNGVFVGDTRVLSRLVLTIAGRRLEPLAAASEVPFASSFVGRVGDPPLLVFRDHWVGRGLRSDVRVRNIGAEARRVRVRYDVAADLADLFAVKEGRASGEAVPVTVEERGLRLGPDGRRRATLVRVSPPAQLGDDGSIVWDVDIAERSEWACCLEVWAVRGDAEVVPRHRCGQAPEEAVPASRQERWRAKVPTLETDVPGLERAVEQAAEDLGALRIFDAEHPDDPVVAAGAPWFMTLFGRDAILSAWMALPLDPGLGLSAARVLARLQGQTFDPEREEQPGRLLHEVRFGESASLALADGSLYYGTADATPLFVMLVAELYRWGVPFDELRPLLPAVDAAIDWMAGPGDPDGDGYIEYQRMTDAGLENQGWKDSWDSVSFASGRLATPPIALAEVQAYAYAAWLAGAELALADGRPAVAAARRDRAQALRDRFNRDFWLDDVGALALALDGDHQLVDAIASNMGHCLWCGIAEPAHAEQIARWLVSPELFSGWGIRTLAPSMGRYDPLSYHNGSVWPHDTAICVAGLRRAGFVDEALAVATGLLRAAQASGGRLPELFSGLGADESPVPVAYPSSCNPQAWASAAPLLVMRALLGFEPDVPAGKIEVDPALPEGSRWLRLEGMPLAGTEVTIEVDGDAVALRGVPRGLAIVRPAAPR